MYLTMQSGTEVKSPPIAVVGYSGSAAEVTAYKLVQNGYDVKMLLDDAPVSPLLQNGMFPLHSPKYFCCTYFFISFSLYPIDLYYGTDNYS